MGGHVKTLSDAPATSGQTGTCDQAAWLQSNDTRETEAEGGLHRDPKQQSGKGRSQGPQAIKGCLPGELASECLWSE